MKTNNENISTVYDNIVKALNDKVHRLGQEIITRPDTDPEDRFSLDQLKEISKSLSMFLVGQAETAYKRAVEKIESQAARRDFLFSSCFEAIKKVVAGDVTTPGRSGIYLLESEECVELESASFKHLFDNLQKLSAHRRLGDHINRKWVQCFEVSACEFTDFLVRIQQEFFGEKLLGAARSCRLSALGCARFKHLYAIVNSCMNSEADDLLAEEKSSALSHIQSNGFNSFLDDIMRDLKDIVNNHIWLSWLSFACCATAAENS